MDIQVIMIVGDRSVTDDGEVEWSNVCKDMHIITLTSELEKAINVDVEVLRQARKLLHRCIKQYKQDTIQVDRG